MRLLTTDEIIQTLQEKGLPITRKQFLYYAKKGLLFSPEKKVKRRLKEGIRTYYAEEILQAVTDLFRYKEEGLSLNEIREIMLENDREALVAMYGKARISLKPHKPSKYSFWASNIDIEKLKVLSWRKEGYYRGLHFIYNDILDKLNSKVIRINNDHDVIYDFAEAIIKELNDPEKKATVRELTGIKNEKLSKEFVEITKIRRKLISERYDPLIQFITEQDIS